MELPERERFTIEKLCDRWEKTRSYLTSITGQLEIRVELFDDFTAVFPEYNGKEHIGYWQKRTRPRKVDFQLTETEAREILKNHRAAIYGQVTIPVSGQSDNRKMVFRKLDKTPIRITLADTYIPSESVLAIEGRSTHRLVIDRLAAHIKTQKKITNSDFARWVHEEYPPISIKVAEKLFTFLNTPLSPLNIPK